MSRSTVDRSPDLLALWEADYDLRLTPGGHLVVSGVPYVAPGSVVKRGRIITRVDFTPDGVAFNAAADHRAWFAGEAPCDSVGRRLNFVNEHSGGPLETGLTPQFMLSSKPADSGLYQDYFHKVTAYCDLLMTPALALEPTVTATPHKVVLEDDDAVSPFVYRDTSSTRAGIVAISDHLRGLSVAIVGMGGTGSYVLEFVSKTPVAEIHIYDDDDFHTHNAFRSPAAATVDELLERPLKVAYHARRYGKMKRNVVPHPYRITGENVGELRRMSFVFLCAEGGSDKRAVFSALEEFGVSFIDVGLALDTNGGAIGGIVCTTTSTPEQRAHVYENGRVDFSEPGPDDDYEDNIQIAELNALNAIQAVIKWKKLCGFYRDLRREHFSSFAVDTNHNINEVI